MSLDKYLNEQESILFQWKIGSKGEIGSLTSGKKVKNNILGITNKRVFHFKKLNGYDRAYRDIPLEKLSYIENAWHSRNRLLLVLSAILLIIGIGLTIYYYTQEIFVGPVLIIIGIISLLKGMKQYGYLMINGEDWKFQFNRKDDIDSIESFIKEVYFIKIV